MSNEKKQEKEIKITDLYSSSVYFVPRTLDDAMVDKLTKTALKLVLKLNRYFSSETGRKNQRNVYRCSELRKELGINDKPISLICFLDIIKQVRDNNLFLIYQNDNTKDKEFTFFLPSENNKAIFEAVEKDEKYFKNKITTHVLDNNIVKIDTNKSTKKDEKITNSTLENTNSSFIFTNCSFKNTNSSFTFANSSFINQNSSFIFNIPETVINTSKIDILETRQDYLYKDNLSKETLTLEKNISNDSTLEKKLLESELKVKAFLESEVKGEIQEQDPELQIDSKNDNELDRLKGILISDYGIYEMVAEKLLKQYSTKAINECIDLTIDAEVNDKIKSTPRDFLMNKLKYWVEKKESVQETSRPAISLKNILMPGEQDFINIFYSKKLVHISQKTLGNCVQALITCARKDVVLEIKEKFSREQIGLFINHFQNTDAFAHKYTNDVARFWQFYNDINELDKYNQELKERNEKARLEIMSKFNGIVKKETVQETLVNDEKILSDLQDDLDSEEIPY